jgi:hypothetical protein
MRGRKKEQAMFWNDPNLYSVAFKDIPTVPPPFFGTFPRYFTPFTPFDVKPNLFPPQLPPTYLTPQIPPAYFTPQVPPAYFTPQIPPSYFTPQIPQTYFTPPVTPFMHNPIHRLMDPLINPMLTPFNYNLPYFQGYRPFGL